MPSTSTPKTRNPPPCSIMDSPESPFTTPEVAAMKHPSLLRLNPHSISKIAGMYHRESLQRESEAFFALAVLVVFIAAHYISFFWYVYQLNNACYFDFILLGIEAFLIFSIMASCCFRMYFHKFYAVFLLGLSLLLTSFTTRIIAFFMNCQIFNDSINFVLLYTISVGVLSAIAVTIARAKSERENFESFQRSRRIILV